MIEDLYPKYAVYRERVKRACSVIRYILIASLFLAIYLFFISKNNVTLFVYINYHYSLRNIIPENFAYVPVIILLLFWGSTSRYFIKLNYYAGQNFRRESREDFAKRQARYSCGTWFSWSLVSFIFILIALSSVCFSPDWRGWALYFYYTVFVFVLNHYFYRCFCEFFKKLEEFIQIA